MIPTRNEIQAKIDALIIDPKLNREDFPLKISEWLDSLEMPETIIIAGETVNPKEQILDDLKSYPNW